MWISSLLDALGYNSGSTFQGQPPPEVVLSVNKPGATIDLNRRRTDSSLRVRIDVWASAETVLILNGQVTTG